MMFMRHISLCIILQLVHTENCADLKNVEFAGSNKNKLFRLFLFISFKMQFSEEKKLLWTGSVGKLKKKRFFFLGSGPKIGSVGTWETDNQLDVPLDDIITILITNSTGKMPGRIEFITNSERGMDHIYIPHIVVKARG